MYKCIWNPRPALIIIQGFFFHLIQLQEVSRDQDIMNKYWSSLKQEMALTHTALSTALSVWDLHWHSKLPVKRLFWVANEHHISWFIKLKVSVFSLYDLWMIRSAKRLVPRDKWPCFLCKCPRCSNRAVSLWEQSWEDLPESRIEPNKKRIAV